MPRAVGWSSSHSKGGDPASITVNAPLVAQVCAGRHVRRPSCPPGRRLPNGVQIRAERRRVDAGDGLGASAAIVSCPRRADRLVATAIVFAALPRPDRSRYRRLLGTTAAGVPPRRLRVWQRSREGWRGKLVDGTGRPRRPPQRPRSRRRPRPAPRRPRRLSDLRPPRHRAPRPAAPPRPRPPASRRSPQRPPCGHRSPPPRPSHPMKQVASRRAGSWTIQRVTRPRPSASKPYERPAACTAPAQEGQCQWGLDGHHGRGRVRGAGRNGQNAWCLYDFYIPSADWDYSMGYISIIGKTDANTLSFRKTSALDEGR